MSVPARQVYETAAIVAACLGNQVDVLDLDPFMSTGRRYLNTKLDVIWVMQLVIGDDGQMYDARRLIIRDSEATPLSEDDVVAAISPEDVSVVFEFYETPDGMGDVYSYIPGEWLEDLFALRAKIPTPWLLPKHG